VPEWLDALPPADPRAERSRRDLRRVNLLMGNRGIVAAALAPAVKDRARIAEIGAGDGSFMLHVARAMHPRPSDVELALVDRAGLVSAATRSRFAELQWHAKFFVADAIAWLDRCAPFDAIVANLFLHHFEAHALDRLLSLVGQRTNVFVACEPRRSRTALAASRTLAFAGCGAVTLHDAAVSVRAGFRGRELSDAWPARRGWTLHEAPRGLFSHLFVARRDEAL
jgi:hypothetical protein